MQGRVLSMRLVGVMTLCALPPSSTGHVHKNDYYLYIDTRGVLHMPDQSAYRRRRYIDPLGGSLDSLVLDLP